MENNKIYIKKIKGSSFALIAILLLIVATVPLTLLSQSAQAQLSTTQPVSGKLPSGVTPSVTVSDLKAYLSFRPNPVGLNQVILVNMWTTPSLNPHRFHQDYTITITKPDNTIETVTLDSYCADATGYFEYQVDQVGVWKFKFDFPGEYFPEGQYYNGYLVTNSSGNWLDSAYYPPVSTGEQELVVQESMIASWPPSSLPTDYWTRPVHLENREWWPILGNYPGDGVVGGGDEWPEDTNAYMSNYNFVPYVQGPNTAHIVWKRLNAIAGITGGTTGIYGITSSAGNPSVIYAGRAYQTLTVPVNGVPTSCAVCYDLRTGQQYYAIPVSQGGTTPTAISYTRGTGEAVPGASETNTFSVTLLSIGTRLIKIDPNTGAISLNVTGISATTNMFYSDPYVMSFQTLGSGVNTKYCLVNWTTAGTETNFTKRIASNITLPWTLPTFPSTAAMGGTSRVYDFEAGVAIWSVGLVDDGLGALYGTWLRGASITTGAELWNINISDTRYSSASIAADHGKVAILVQNGYWIAFDSLTGKQVWKSELMEYPWGAPSFGAYAVQSAYGLLYRESYDGIYAFNWTTGKIAWHTKAVSEPFETPYDGNNPFNSGGIIADGKLYVANSEHTTTWPRSRGWKLFCINATSGEGIWNITGAATPGGVADGYLTAANGDDGYFYVYGKGQSATKVESPLTAITLGESVVLKGTVLDQSPAQADTACVSKESIATQMEYLHMQLPIDGIHHNVSLTGVPVSLDAVDPNGNSIHIGDVVTDGYSGTFGYTWEPEVSGQYTVTATFLGDDSYGSSFATTYVGVTEAEAASPTSSPITFDVVSNTIMTGLVVVGVAIIIAIAIAVVLLLRKKP
ncbi:MAG: PQQ-binding-like beta-propeller repeat protein [Candidatus Bathyarchaeia archaeon]